MEGVTAQSACQRVTVCQLSGDERFDSEWQELVRHARGEQSDLIVLPELSHVPWIFGERVFDQRTWDAAESLAHERIRLLDEFVSGDVVGTRPRTRDGRRNE